MRSGQRDTSNKAMHDGIAEDSRAVMKNESDKAGEEVEDAQTSDADGRRPLSCGFN